MDHYDRCAMDELSRHPQYWCNDTLYSGSRVLTDEGRAKRDALAAAWRGLPSGGGSDYAPTSLADWIPAALADT